MAGPTRQTSRSLAALGVLLCSAAFAAPASARERPAPAHPSNLQGPGERETGCTPEQRREALRALQAEVLRLAPRAVDSLERAVQPGGPLAGWRLSHGLVVIDGGGAVPVDNLAAKDPLPPLLLYEPSPTSSPDDWLDFDGPDGPYRLVGWGEIAPYRPGSGPPHLPCIAKSEWLVHEAGWHLMDGGMLLTPKATAAPAHPEHQSSGYFWHPRAWDLHFWIGADGVPDVSFHNPDARRGGVRLPEGAFFYLVDGRQQPPPEPHRTSRRGSP
jgi:hypothetical protein